MSDSLLTAELVSDGAKGLAALAKRNLGFAAPTLNIYIHTEAGERTIGGGNQDLRSIKTATFDGTVVEWIKQQLVVISLSLGIDVRFNASSSDSNLDIYLCEDIPHKGSTVLGITLNNDNGKQAWAEILLNNNLINGNSELIRYTFRHELGHALGLEHPFDASDGDTHGEAFGDPDGALTLMSYTRPTGGWPDHYSSADWLALISIWGLKSSNSSGWLFSTAKGPELILDASMVLARLGKPIEGDQFLGAASIVKNSPPTLLTSASLTIWTGALKDGLTVSASQLFEDSDNNPNDSPVLIFSDLQSTLPGLSLEDGYLRVAPNSNLPIGKYTIKLTASDGSSFSQPADIDLVIVGITGIPEHHSIYSFQPLRNLQAQLNVEVPGPVNWSLAGPDHILFKIDPHIGTITMEEGTEESPDNNTGRAESFNYSIVIRATDNRGNQTETPLQLEVKGLNQALAANTDDPLAFKFREFPSNSRLLTTVTTTNRLGTGIDVIIGFYRTLDSQGSVLDTKGISARPGDSGYAEAALQEVNLVNEIGYLMLSGKESDSATKSQDHILNESMYIAPYAIIDSIISPQSITPTAPDSRGSLKQNNAGIEPAQPGTPIPLGSNAGSVKHNATVFAYHEANPKQLAFFSRSGHTEFLLHAGLTCASKNTNLSSVEIKIVANALTYGEPL